jgi:hypothetical protein
VIGVGVVLFIDVLAQLFQYLQGKGWHKWRRCYVETIPSSDRRK